MRAAASAQTFDFYPLRFRFAASKLRDFSANTLRGAFGRALKKVDAEAYSRYFAPTRCRSGPAGLPTPPRPFVFRMFGPLEVGTELVSDARTGDSNCSRGRWRSWERSTSVSGTERLCLPLCAPISAIDRVRVQFLTPTELKGAERPEFGVLLARIRDRVSTLRELYGDGPLAIDFKAFGERAGRVSMTRCELSAGRRRTHQPRHGPTAFAGRLHRIR